MNYITRVFFCAILAGIYISLGGCVYLAQPLIGAILFVFGLICIIKQNLRLFTGMAGFVQNRSQDYIELLVVLMGNFVGTFCGACIAKAMKPEIVQSAIDIISNRIETSSLDIFFLSICCGIIMSVSVCFAKRNEGITDWLPLLFGIPLFIYCDMVHCIADSLYFWIAISEKLCYIAYLPKLFIAVLGNFVGCNLYRFLIVKAEE